jgi:uncharacterized damage-inducible protein DinB
MKTFLLSLLLLICGATFSQNATTRSVLLKELKSTHTEKDWFVPINVAIEGLTKEQALWKDKSGNHSVAELTYHLIFWNERELAKFKGEKESAFSGNNEETFDVIKQKSWDELVKKIDNVMKELEKLIETADEAKLKEWYGEIANISTHNAYHTGQIIFVRKQQGVWNPDKGVK